MIMPDKLREECFRTSIFMNKFEKGREKRKELLKSEYEKAPDNIQTAYTYGSFCFLYGEKGDILDQKDAIVEAQRVFNIIGSMNKDEWLARYFSIRLNMLVSDDFRNDRDIFDDIVSLEKDEQRTDDVVFTQMTQLMKAESLFNMKRFDESTEILEEVKNNCKRITILKDFFFNQVSSLYRKMIICQETEFANKVKEIQDLMFA